MKNSNLNNQKNNLNKGQALLISLVFFSFLSLSIVMGLSVPVVREFRISSNNLESKKSFFLSESGVEDAYYRIKTSQTIGTAETITLDNHSVVTNITDSGYNEKTISSEGSVLSRERINRVVLNTGTGVSFSYGVQSGQGGFIIANNAVVNGSVYSNGSITGSGTIAGSATSANSASLIADQENGSGVPAYDVTFGDSNSTQDFAQSFQISTTEVINKVDLYIKKIGTPSNLTVRIVSDNSGSPSTSELASGSLSASLVSTTYGWVEVPFSSNPQLSSGTTYWMVIDGGTHASRYYQIGANNNGYGSGAGKIGSYGGSWSNTSPAGLDSFFKVYTGGITGIIDGVNVGTAGVGNAYAHTINNATIEGTNYCQIGSGNNKACNTSLPDPTQVAMPISEQNILDWKAEAEAGGTYSGNYIVDGTTTSLGPTRITGNLTVKNNAVFTITGTLWVEGDMLFDNGSLVKLSPSYGSSEGVVVADGTITISNNASFEGSGVAGSYPMLLTTSYSDSAITLNNNAGAVILYAGNGTINVSNNAGAVALTAFKINLEPNAEIDYNSGLANSNFVNGPSGGWNISSWQETE